MSLDWSIDKVKDWKSISMADENGDEAQKTHSLIWATLSVGLPGITEKNTQEFFWRLKTLEQRQGSFMYRFHNDTREDYLFTPEDVQRRVGLSTNVSTQPRVSWVARVVKNLTRDEKLTPEQQKALKKEILATAPKKAKAAK